MSAELERKLRLAESAAASAVLNGCDPEDVLARCRAGIAEAVALNNRRASRQVAAQAPTPVTSRPPARTSALDAFARAVEAA